MNYDFKVALDLLTHIFQYRGMERWRICKRTKNVRKSAKTETIVFPDMFVPVPPPISLLICKSHVNSTLLYSLRQLHQFQTKHIYF